MNALYYESHVTIDPSDRLEELKQICKVYSFKVADLYMDKSGTAQLSEMDMFMTGHGNEYEGLMQRMKELIGHLIIHSFVVRRAKIEAVLFDTRKSRTTN